MTIARVALAMFCLALAAPEPASAQTVDVKAKTGELEAALLANKAIQEAAAEVDVRLRAVLGSAPQTIVAFAAGDAPSFQELTLYNAQYAIVEQALNSARAAAAALPPPPTLTLPALGAAGVEIDALDKLLAVVQTDYTSGGVEVALEDHLLVAAVAGRLSAGKLFTVLTPGTYNAGAIANDPGGIVADLLRLANLRAGALNDAKIQDAVADKLADQDAVRRRKQVSEGLKAAAALFDAWFAKLSTGDTKSAAPLVPIIRQKTVAAALQKASLLIVKIQVAGGGYLVKKNLWTVFGAMPLYHMGGAAISYTLLNGPDGVVLAAGSVSIHGGFVKAGDVRDALAGK